MEPDQSGEGLTPDGVAAAEFAQSWRGYDPQEVRSYLRSVAAALQSAQGGVSADDLRAQLREAQAEIEQLRNRLSEVDARKVDLGELDEAELVERLGEETSRILRSAHDAAAGIITQAEQRAEAIIADANADAQRIAQQAEADAGRRIGEADRHALKLRAEADDIKRAAQAEAETEIAAAKERGRLVVTQARVKRDEIESEIEAAKARYAHQLDQLELGRARIAEAYDAVARALTRAGVEIPPAPDTGPLDPAAAAETSQEPEAERAAESGSEPGTEVAAEATAGASATGAGALVDDEVRGGLEAFISPSVSPDEPSEPDPSVEPGPPAAARAAVESAAPAEGAHDGDEVGARVDELFEQIRQERAVAASRPGPTPSDPDTEAGAGAEAAGTGAPESHQPDAAEPAEPVDPLVAAARDRLDSLRVVETQLVRSLKRALADEQNRALERLRELDSSDVRADAILDVAADQARYGSAVAAHIEAAALVGASSVGRADVDPGTLAGGTTAITDALAGELARSLLEGIDQVLPGADDPDLQADRIRAVYRQWRVQRLGEMARHYAIAAFNRAIYDAVDVGTRLCWEPDPDSPVSATCQPNVGVCLPKGEKFPSGHLLPPTVAGCRCQLTLGT